MGAQELSAWNSVRYTLLLRLWKVDNDLEQRRGLLGEDSVLEISRNMSQSRSFGNDVAQEIKTIYPVLSTCRSILERLVATVSPVHVSSLVVRHQYPFAHIEYRILLPAFRLLSCGQKPVR